ncbi:hypothetical protein J3R30DRAFT_3408750 [Lentinula aciculospora]|uniref:Uncharacterized protein n=1 Tax=Lentinula aciculospora TaxID=153920 RepID=A0A9W8ZYK1_9AGAR|nr:hypothetical protein J3R30DRAFT_3408750 [Lentinula aciculospora]
MFSPSSLFSWSRSFAIFVLYAMLLSAVVAVPLNSGLDIRGDNEKSKVSAMTPLVKSGPQSNYGTAGQGSVSTVPQPSPDRPFGSELQPNNVEVLIRYPSSESLQDPSMLWLFFRVWQKGNSIEEGFRVKSTSERLQVEIFNEQNVKLKSWKHLGWVGFSSKDNMLDEFHYLLIQCIKQRSRPFDALNWVVSRLNSKFSGSLPFSIESLNKFGFIETVEF